jgi:predicted transcriptional regulator
MVFIMDMATSTKDKMLFARVEEALIRRLKRVAKQIDRAPSWIVREAVKAELDRIEGKVK